MPIDPNEAPDGYVAVVSNDGRCEGCALSPHGSDSCLAVADACCHWQRDDGQDVIFVKRPEAQAAPAAVAEPSTPFTDPRVQIVYGLLADSEAMPPDGQHWEGWVARRIVDALAAAPAAAQPVAQEALMTAWMDPATRDVISGERKHAWLTRYGAGGKERAETYTIKLGPIATPPALVGLSDEQIWDAAWGAGLTEGGEVRDALAFARAIERAMAAANGMTLRLMHNAKAAAQATAQQEQR